MLQLAIKSGMESVIVSYGLGHAVAAIRSATVYLWARLGEKLTSTTTFNTTWRSCPSFWIFWGSVV